MHEMVRRRVLLCKCYALTDASDDAVMRRGSLKEILSGYVMADLVLQDFSDLSIENLVQVLSNEKTKMFGELKLHNKRREDNRLGSRPFAGSMLTLEKPGGITKC